MVTGNVGPNAFQVLQPAGVPVYLFNGGTVRQAAEAYKAGALSATGGASRPAHAGMGTGGKRAMGGDMVSNHEETAEETAHSAKVFAESSNPEHMTRMDEPDVWGIIHGCYGDTMEIYLRLDGGRIAGATFMTDGHESAIACANVLCKMVRG